MSYAYKKPQGKPKRDQKKQGYAPTQPAKQDKKARPLRNARKNANDDFYFYKKKPDSEFQEVLRQDLVNTGVSIWERKEVSEAMAQLVESFPDCFEVLRRPVMFNLDEPSMFSAGSKSKFLKREDLKSEYDLLADNEEIPDWFEANAGDELAFDFNSAVSKGLTMKREGSKYVPEEPHQLRSDMPPEEIDQLLEELFQKEADQREESSDEAEEPAESPPRSNRSGSEGKRSDDPVEESQEFFDKIHNNIKKMFDSNSDHDDDRAAEEEHSLDPKQPLLVDVHEDDAPGKKKRTRRPPRARRCSKSSSTCSRPNCSPSRKSSKHYPKRASPTATRRS